MNKILFITPSIGYGGAEKQLAILAKELNNKGIKTIIMPLRNNAQKSILPEFRNLNLIETGIKDKFSILDFFRLRKIIKVINPDIVQGWMYGGNILSTILTIGMKKKIFHSIRASDMDLERYGRQITFNGLLTKFVNKVVFNSKAGYLFHKNKFFIREKMVIIPNGIDTDTFKPSLSLRQKMRKKLGISKNKKVIVFAARIDPMKAHKKVLEIASICTDIIFLLVGKGTNEINVPNNVIALGICNDMPSIYNSADMMLHLSNYGEGFSNVVGEAMSCGLPILVNNIGDSKGIIGNTGIIINSKNSKKIENKIRFILQNKTLTKNKINIRQRIISNFSISRMVNSYIKLYEGDKFK